MMSACARRNGGGVSRGSTFATVQSVGQSGKIPAAIWVMIILLGFSMYGMIRTGQEVKQQFTGQETLNN